MTQSIDPAAYYTDARQIMRKLWRRWPWPTWLRDEWEGEAAVALLAAVRTYRGDRGATFTTWLYKICSRNALDWKRKADYRHRGFLVYARCYTEARDAFTQ